MKETTKAKIAQLLEETVRKAIARSSASSPGSSKPFHEALLSPEIIRYSAFERSFSTSFGQSALEKIAKLVAVDNGYEAELQKEVNLSLYKGALDEIEIITSGLRDNIRKPNWSKELRTIASINKGGVIAKKVISDIWLSKDGCESFISIKTVKPNLDQTEKAKKDMLLLKAHDPNYDVYFALPYNPFGDDQKSYGFTMPSKVFDMKFDACVLIGKPFWDLIGGRGAYEEIIGVFEEVGADARAALASLKKYTS